ncbi:MAG: heavy metal translocating P-type ATPase [Spirochaetales bacterium]|nr:heavy metal translocating P-type ATPase [Spirochaetales bacterium]
MVDDMEQNNFQDFSFAIGGMTCVSCSSFVEKTLAELPGVHFVSVNLSTGKTYVRGDSHVTKDLLFLAVQKAGYTALDEVLSDDDDQKRFRSSLRNVILAWAAAALAMGIMMFLPASSGGFGRRLFDVLIGLIVIVGPGKKILKGALIAIRHHHANMDVLVALGALAAWATGVASAFGLPLQSFAALSPMIPAFHLTGRLLEERLRRKAGKDVRALMTNTHSSVRVVHEDGEIHEIPVDTVSLGMRIRILSGESIPLDGKILSGEGAVGEALVTGESLPVYRGVGEEVIGGTVLERGSLDVEVLRTGDDAFLAKMLTLVEQAQGQTVPLQALADRIAARFVPAVVFFAFIAFLLWGIFGFSWLPLLENLADIFPWIPQDSGSWTIGAYVFVALLVVACPCALGLATPLAVSVGAGAAARRGILFKDGAVMQNAAHLDVVIFDKTGTLTQGKPQVVFSSLSPEEAGIAAALEHYSVHPLAQAVTDWAETMELSIPEVEEVEELPGEGIVGKVHSHLYRLGRPSPDFSKPEVVPSGATIVSLDRDGESVGILAFIDPLKKEAQAAVAKLQSLGVQPVMATGDGESAAMNVAKQVGIPKDNVHWRMKPEGKLELVQSLRGEGRVAMAGDGINDAAALKAADAGFALAEGTDLSLEAGDVVILKGGLARIPETMALSRAIGRKVKGNLLWAFGYNLLAFPLAAAALVHPLMAEVAMSLSSITVVMNSLSLRKRGESEDKEPEMKTLVFDVRGMSCNHCVARVEKSLEPLASRVNVDLENGQVTVDTDQSPAQISAAINEAGFSAFPAS